LTGSKGQYWSEKKGKDNEGWNGEEQMVGTFSAPLETDMKFTKRLSPLPRKNSEKGGRKLCQKGTHGRGSGNRNNRQLPTNRANGIKKKGFTTPSFLTVVRKRNRDVHEEQQGKI